jgi:hypothetical protein
MISTAVADSATRTGSGNLAPGSEGRKRMCSQKAVLESVADENWASFKEARFAVLMLARSDCPACKEWTKELEAYLEQNHNFANVRFGKLNLDEPSTSSFRKENEEWLELVEGVPFNVLYDNGEPVASFAGAGAKRLRNRLKRLTKK